MAETHPVQMQVRNPRVQSRVPTAVTLRAYDVYCHVFSPQEAIITGNCRGGFGAGEIIALLYAHTFPKDEWKARFDEALKGMENM